MEEELNKARQEAKTWQLRWHMLSGAWSEAIYELEQNGDKLGKVSSRYYRAIAREMNQAHREAAEKSLTTTFLNIR